MKILNFRIRNSFASIDGNIMEISIDNKIVLGNNYAIVLAIAFVFMYVRYYKKHKFVAKYWK